MKETEIYLWQKGIFQEMMEDLTASFIVDQQVTQPHNIYLEQALPPSTSWNQNMKYMSFSEVYVFALLTTYSYFHIYEVCHEVSE